MPGFSKTGPDGEGPVTGHRMGRCTNYGRNLKKTENTPSSEQNVNSPENFPGRCFGWGGGGRGSGRVMLRQSRSIGGF